MKATEQFTAVWKKNGGMGVTSAWSPLGNFSEGQAHTNVFAFCLSSNQVFLFFVAWSFLCLLSGGSGFSTEVVVMFIFK